MEGLNVDHFKTLISASGNNLEMEFLAGLQGLVLEMMNEELNKAYSTEEVYKALMQMHPTKTPGSKGMSPIFFSKNTVKLLVNQLVR